MFISALKSMFGVRQALDVSIPCSKQVIATTKSREVTREEYENVKLEVGESVYTLASPLKPIQASDYISTMKIMADKQVELGTMVLYLYKKEKRVKRVFKIAELQVKDLLRCKKMRYYLTDLVWSPQDTDLEKAKAQTCEDLERLFALSAGANTKAKKAKHEADQKPFGSLKSKAVEPNSLPMAKTEATKKVTTTESTVLQGAVKRPAAGKAEVGVVVEMGPVIRNGGSSGTYTSFCLKLDVDGVHKPFYGVELEREVRERQVNAGDTVRLICMGQETTIKGGHKNLYRIEVI